MATIQYENKVVKLLTLNLSQNMAGEFLERLKMSTIKNQYRDYYEYHVVIVNAWHG
jgi:hypothetical protein